MHYYLIHGIDPTRKPFMENQFQLHGIERQEVTWINYPNKNDYITSGICIHPSLTKGQIACTYKHYLALKDIVEKDLEIAVIMEDNIEFKGNVPNAIDRYINDLPLDWDIVWDSDFLGIKYDGEITNRSVYRNDSSKGANFYIVNKRSAKILYDNFLPFNNCSDHHYNDLIKRHKLICYWAEPSNVHKIYRPSTWKDEPKKYLWLQNLSIP